MNLDIGLMTFDLRAVAGYARRAEAVGFGAIWSAQTRHDPFLPLAVASTTTSRVGLGTAIAVAFPRSPMILAHIPGICRRSRADDLAHARPRRLPGRHRGGAPNERAGGQEQIAFYASTRTYQTVLAVHGLEDLVPRLHAKSLAGDWEGMADLIGDETLDHSAASGSFATIGERIRERYRGLYDRTQLYPSFQPSLDDSRWPTVLAGFRGA